jgi:hypothetical protein
LALSRADWGPIYKDGQLNLDLKLYEEIEKALGERLEQIASEVVSGKPVDYSDYKLRVGKISGLREALLIANEAQKRVLGIDETRKG